MWWFIVFSVFVDVYADSKRFTFTYNATVTAGNPWTGLVPYAPDKKTPFPHSMENFYFPMAKLMVAWNKYTLAEFEQKLNDTASRGMQTICRIYLDYPGKTLKPTDGVPAFLVPGLRFYSYKDGVSPDWSNTTLQQAMYQLIAHLGSVYDGDRRIAFWQVGFLGKWGEWHDEGGPPFASIGVQREVLLTFNKSFEKTALLVRYPDVIGGLDANSIRIGFHDDSFFQDTLGGAGTPNWHFMNRMATAKAMDRWKSVPIGGEVRPELQKCIFAENISKSCAGAGIGFEDPEQCVQATHSSWQWDNHIKDGYSAEDTKRALAVAASMGYTFYLSAVILEQDIQKKSFNITAEVQNRGVAPPYYSLRMQLTYPCDASHQGKTVFFGNDLMELLPSSSPTLFKSKPIGIVAGCKDVCISLGTPHAVRPVKFAINGADSNGMVKVVL